MGDSANTRDRNGIAPRLGWILDSMKRLRLVELGAR